MKLVIDNIDDLIFDADLKCFDEIEINAPLFYLFIKSPSFRNLLKKNIILTLRSQRSLLESDSLLSAYALMVGFRSFELCDRYCKDGLYFIVFRMVADALEITAGVDFDLGKAALPVRYRIADAINSFLIKMKLQQVLKRLIKLRG